MLSKTVDSSDAAYFLFFSFPRAKVIEQQTNGEVFLICEENLQKSVSLSRDLPKRNYGKQTFAGVTNLTSKPTHVPIDLPTIMPDVQIGNAESSSHRTGGSNTIRNRYSPSSPTVANYQLTLTQALNVHGIIL